ncbi:hypothetical protein F4777DRAFT_464156 [Nemania sp. FL0916]|nr:hypothetical protein F4777DRAFT_464156 [Nemania sp. FL0916]
MAQYSNNDYSYYPDGYYPLDGGNYLYCDTGTDAGTAMVRELSGDSILTSSTYDQAMTPNSDYGAFDSAWSPTPVDNFSTPSPTQEITFSPTSYYPSNLPNPGEYPIDETDKSTTSGHDSWFLDYDFIAQLEPSQAPFWRLKAGLQPTPERPATVPVPQTQTNESMYGCFHPHCSMNFRRKADLERHYEQLHTPADKKAKYPCDRKKCSRGAENPFHRMDHYRDHLRAFHFEDLVRRRPSGTEKPSWWEKRSVDLAWWRCTRCLTRVKVDEHGYICSNSKCNSPCEPERQKARLRMAKKRSSA